MPSVSQLKFMTGLAIVIAITAIWSVMVAGGVSRTSTSNGSLNLLASGWNFVPGADVSPDGLHVHHLGRAIARQNGDAGQSNPPVNSYGTHLKANGDFSLRAMIKNIKGTASLQLYNENPIIQDEFRVEPKSVRLSITGSTLTVLTWNNYANKNVYAQTSATTAHYKFKPKPTATILLQRQSGHLGISVNGERLATIDQNIFDSGNIWFGVDADNPGDSWTLSGLIASSNSTGKVGIVNTQTVLPVAKNSRGLQQLASRKRPGFLVGATLALPPAVSDPSYSAIAFGGNFGAVTTENVLKWQFIHPQPDMYDFKEADALVTLAKKNNLAVNGHTLVFGEANPKWVQDLPIATDADKQHVKQVMIDHITQTVSHFKNKISTWDVVNEPMADYDDTDTTDQLRQHIWYKAMGADYIAAAFNAAHQADPKAKLYINEYGLEEDGDRWNTFFALVSKLKSQGVPIDGVGFQAHEYESSDRIDTAVLRAHIRALGRIGLTARISEMDVYSDDGTTVQAQQYADVFNACIQEPNCVSWTTWGITDKYDLSLNDNNILQYGQDFLWNEKSQPTEAVAQIKKILSD